MKVISQAGIVLCCILFAQPGAAQPVQFSAGASVGLFNYSSAPISEEFSPVFTGAVEALLKRTAFLRLAVSHTQTNSGCVDECPSDTTEPLTLARLLGGAGMSFGSPFIYLTAGPQSVRRPNETSRTILVWGAGVDFALSNDGTLFVEHLRHNHDTGTSWELSGGLKWGLN